MIAGEKQAARSVICFSAIINEQISDEIGYGARQRGFASLITTVIVLEAKDEESFSDCIG